MASDDPAVLSLLDEARFGVRTARATGFVKKAALDAVLNFCVSNRVQFLIARSRVEDVDAAQEMECHGFLITETTALLTRDLVELAIPRDASDLRIRPFAADDERTIRTIAARSFEGYFGHYHADPRLDRAKCDEAYVDWASRSCVNPEVADAVLVAESATGVVGFLTLKRNSPEECQPMLSGVLPESRGHGVYRLLIREGLEWAQSLGAVRSVAAVHVANVAVVRTLQRLGYELTDTYHTFHKWFD